MTPRSPHLNSAQHDVVRFLAWARTIDDDERALATTVLGRAYLAGRLCLAEGEPEKVDQLFRLETRMRDAEACLAGLAQDGSISVRRALAVTFAAEREAPRSLIIALINDEPGIACEIARRTPILTDAELVGLAINASEPIKIAVAERPVVSESVAGALVANGGPGVILALLVNREACLTTNSFRHIAERFKDDAAIQKLLLARKDLPASIRYDVISARLSQIAFSCMHAEAPRRRAEQLANTVRERETLRISTNLSVTENRDLARHLLENGVLTTGLLIRALVSGNRSFFEAAAAVLSGIEPERTAALVRNFSGAGFEVLYRCIGFPQPYLEPVRTALAIIYELGCSRGCVVSRTIVSRVIENCDFSSPDLGLLLALLRRLESEAALDEGHLLLQAARSTVEQWLSIDSGKDCLPDPSREIAATPQIGYPKLNVPLTTLDYRAVA